jgi:hypothetical protein
MSLRERFQEALREQVAARSQEVGLIITFLTRLYNMIDSDCQVFPCWRKKQIRGFYGFDIFIQMGKSGSENRFQVELAGSHEVVFVAYQRRNKAPRVATFDPDEIWRLKLLRLAADDCGCINAFIHAKSQGKTPAVFKDMTVQQVGDELVYLKKEARRLGIKITAVRQKYGEPVAPKFSINA